MNERIRELAEQAKQYAINQLDETGELHKYYDVYFEKFAELIVCECATEILKWKDEPFPFDEDLAARLIMDHFGVKQ